MKFTGTFATSGAKVEDVPHDHCYDEERLKSMEDEEREKCNDSKAKAKESNVITLLF